MSDIPCPYCGVEYESGDFPDHEKGDTIECDTEWGGCGNTFKITQIDWDPVYYTEKTEVEND